MQHFTAAAHGRKGCSMGARSTIHRTDGGFSTHLMAGLGARWYELCEDSICSCEKQGLPPAAPQAAASSAAAINMAPWQPACKQIIGPVRFVFEDRLLQPPVNSTVPSGGAGALVRRPQLSCPPSGWWAVFLAAYSQLVDRSMGEERQRSSDAKREPTTWCRVWARLR